MVRAAFRGETMKALAVVFAVLAAAACGPGLRDGADDDGGGGGDDGVGTGTPRQCNQMDILFVVDDSMSMKEEQTNLAANFPMFAKLLSSYTTPGGDKIDFRVAVTTTGKDLHYVIDYGPYQMTFNEKGDNGAFRNNCG